MPKKCLLIDDDPDDREIFEMCVANTSSDIRLTAMHECPATISLLESDPGYVPDYIFLDVNMPKMNGWECLKALKTLDRLKDTKIYMYSTTSAEASLADAKRLGADDFIVKPSNMTQLTERLSKIFDAGSDNKQAAR